VAWYRHIHANLDLSGQEFNTTEFVADLLASIGLRPKPAGNGLVCDIGSHRRRVGLRADLDALPLTELTGLPYVSTALGACHACGHHAHTAILFATGLALASAPSCLAGYC
jgi:metal-dependent amidase/aminoacylase/carboxypeptidase family protein